MKTIGIDLGSSSIKLALLDTDTGKCIACIQVPETEMPIRTRHFGWAEQNPAKWWNYLINAIPVLIAKGDSRKEDIRAIGISYQMHGLVCVDKENELVRESIIWCDSRAVPYGAKAVDEIGKEKCLPHLLNSPGNFTASKLAWVQEMEPENFRKTHKIMLPGDFLVMKLTGETTTTVSGLSEGILWDFMENRPAGFLLDYFGFDHSLLSSLVPTFGIQGKLTAQAAELTGLMPGTPVTYRAGDQPNNAFSLNVLQPGEIAATAGTSGVVYGVTDLIKFDPLSRVNTFIHVNHEKDNPRLGVLLCINGTGILNSWMQKTVAPDLNYDAINLLASAIPAGSEGLTILPFGNGSERMLDNRDIGGSFSGLNFNIHGRGHLLRAAQEGIAFSIYHGMKIMEEVGITISVIRAGKANLFLSPVFRQTLADISGATIQLYDTDGALGAARGAALGAGIYSSFTEVFTGLNALDTVEPEKNQSHLLNEAYQQWKDKLMAATGQR